MGNVSSRPDEGATLYLRDQTRLSISSLVVSNSGKRTSIQISPNGFPATRVAASRPAGDGTPIEFIQDPEYSSGAPAFILKLSSEDELMFTFTFNIRQTPSVLGDAKSPPADTLINGLTHVYAATPREVETLVTREFHADPNLHKNSNVELIGDFTTGGSPSVTFDWSWKWKPPKASEDPGGGWRNTCSFVQYDQRAHELQTLASFSFWVQNVSPFSLQPTSPSPPFHLTVPPRTRGASSQSLESRISNLDMDEPVSPPAGSTEFKITSPAAGSNSLVSLPAAAPEPVKVDISCARPSDDVSQTDDGPVFRATMKALEQKTGNMRMQMKRVIKKAEAAHNAQLEANETFVSFIEALKEASSTNANAVQPAIEHYFDKIAREILSYEKRNTVNLQKIVIEPLNRVYTMDIKQAEAKKRDFEEESKDFYAYVGRYLGQRQDSVKAKHSDTKYQTKRRNFELKRFDYSSFMQDLSGGRKEQEVLSHLTRYADAQARTFLEAAKRVEILLPQLEALSSEVQVADKEYQFQRREREEKRRLLEKSNANYIEPDSVPTAGSTTTNGNGTVSDSEMSRADSTGSQLRAVAIGNSSSSASNAGDLSRSPGSLGHAMMASPSQKFKGIRDLEERDAALAELADRESQRKEGLLWALNRPGGHVDPRNLNKQGWHKFWIVLDQGKLSEYSNWKQRLDLHMEPIDLRMASVREARNAERRFCFEVITPQFKRVYQATSEDDMNNWITAINNALQSAVEGRVKDKPIQSDSPSLESSGSFRRDIGSILTGKSPSLGHAQAHPPSLVPGRRITVGARPSTARAPSSVYDEQPDKLLQTLRDHDQGNCWCADCGSGSKVEWVSINLAIILCIECSGIHRSLGTHISKVRSLTLDITSFTPDIVELLLLVGNRVANMVWEGKLEPGLKPGAQATREQRLRFITAKYVDRAFVEPISATLSRYPSPDETLLAAIKKNEIQQVIYALALRANPNVLDKSRGTHAVFLALAAADPAAPGGMPLSPPTQSETKPVPFPIAEMLLQNGAELPQGLPAIPLSRSAQIFLDLKRDRSTGSKMGTSTSSSSQFESLSVGLSSSHSLSSSRNRDDKDKEHRIAKRASAGGRLAKSPIPER
ncbi:PH domain-containing protein [Coniella lustricola]|uniref:ADP-ribosylation factor GTPase-activating protein n=1 Tax=Coniella lustricola TaxID=2025994 RepID=A0A2T3AMF3_9PEZI|nr:PH domain-containing protein [Coniella lustricola]